MADDDKKATHYVVQMQDPETNYWGDMEPMSEDVVDYEAVNAQKAIQNAMKEHGIKEGNFRAIPLSSAKVYSPKLEVKERTVW